MSVDCIPIYTALKEAIYGEGRPILVGRNGSIELAAMLMPEKINADVLERHTGVWPPDKSTITAWRNAYIEANRSCDCIAAGWYVPLAQLESELCSRLCPDAVIIPLRSLEPYYNLEKDLRWTCLLSGQRVAVVSSFAATMKSQLSKRSLIWPNDHQTLLPDDTVFSFIRTGYAPKMAGKHRSVSWDVDNWKAAVDLVVKQVLETRSKVALIGCGGLGMIIGSELKKHGVSAVIMGGAIQVLFGIKGKRWATHPVISGFWNDAGWVYPADDEIPELSSTVEQACYWK